MGTIAGMSKPPISAKTQLCAVIGNPIGHSLSPAIHNAGYEALGLDFVYVAFRVENLAAALDGMRALNHFRGMSVTIPHKVEALELVDHVADIDRHIGSINTIVNDNGKLTGLGTDGPGALKALTDAGAEIAGKTVLILGAGGASRAVSFAVADQGKPAKVLLTDIDKQVASELAAALKEGTEADVEAEVCSDAFIREAAPQADIVINCTPIGMHPKEDASLVPPELFQPGQVVFDIVYNPLKTKLLREAEAAGCTVVPGAEMFVNQAVLQFETFTGQDAPYAVMHKVVLENLAS